MSAITGSAGIAAAVWLWLAPKLAGISAGTSSCVSSGQNPTDKFAAFWSNSAPTSRTENIFASAFEFHAFMTAMLVAQGLRKQFASVIAVDGVNLEVSAGEIVGLLGPNGAGKTTTLRMLTGVLSPTAGNVFIRGWDVRERPLETKRCIGFLSGDTQLYQRLTPREVLWYFGRLYGLSPDQLTPRIQALLVELEMTSFADRPCRTLSSGQKQRANIARALLHQPEILMLDEPTAALDVVSGHFIHEAIRRERAAGRAVLFSTHIMSEAERLCDRIYLLHEGRIADHGTLPEILRRAGCDNLTDAFLRYARTLHACAAPPSA